MEVRADRAGGELQTVRDLPVLPPLEVVEERDVKGWYAKARSGQVTDLTGVDDPYEPPLAAELTLHTTDTTPEANARRIVDYLEEHGRLG